MPPRFLRINGLTAAERHRTIAALRDAVNGSGGWVTDFKFFSNHSVCINFEIPARHVTALSASLAALDLRLSEASAASIDSFDAGDETPAAESEVMGTLQVSFIHNDPDLRVELPPIPG